MANTPMNSIPAHFETITDPRAETGKRHNLVEMIVIAICAVICGADGWVAVEAFGWARYDWLSRFLSLPHGIPSHDTFGRVFAALAPAQFEECFRNWMTAVSSVTKGQIIPIDGKQLRRSYDSEEGKAAIHLVSAWASDNGVVLGQVAVDDKSNEITAIPQLLDALDICGCIVTIDAIGCQKEIAQKIVDHGGDYVLALKANQAHKTRTSNCCLMPCRPANLMAYSLVSAVILMKPRPSKKTTDVLRL